MLKQFLEASSIHGMYHISHTKKCQKIFWMFVVFAGFSGAFVLIRESFQSWAESPIKTTIETLPISELTFPKITVCPPRNTFTSFNYDLVKMDKMIIDNKFREELMDQYLLINHEDKFSEILTSLDLVRNEKRLYEWYNGYTDFMLPTTMFSKDGTEKFYYVVRTSSLSGSVASLNFGMKFNISSVPNEIVYWIELMYSEILIDKNLTMVIDIQKQSMKFPKVGSSYDRFEIQGVGKLPTDLNKYGLGVRLEKNLRRNTMTLQRQASGEDIESLGRKIKAHQRDGRF